MILGEIEASTSKNTSQYAEATSPRYVNRPAAWGFGLCEVEQIMTPATRPTRRAISGAAARTCRRTSVDVDDE